jgi:uroporphyrin-3 C-methyltransferase
MSDNEADHNEGEAGDAPASRALTPAAEDGGHHPPPNKLAIGLALAALAAALLMAGAIGYGGWRVWNELSDVRAQAESAAARAEEAASSAANGVRASELDRRASRLASRIGELDKRIAELADKAGGSDEGIAKLRERVAAVESARQSLNQRMSEVESIARTNKDEWKRSEAAYLATVAVHRLRYYRDIDAALGALKEAHELLSDFGGEYIEARKGVARAIDRLIEVDPPRLDELRQRLAELDTAVERLPTARRPGKGDAQGAGGGDEAARMKGDSWSARAGHAWDQFTGSLGELVKVSRKGEGAPLRTPDERFFLVHNLKLQIEAARLAAMRGDQAAFEASLQRVRDWLGTYFPANDQRVVALREQVAQVAEANVSVQLPEIAPLVERVRSFE